VEPKFADSVVARLLDVPVGTSLILRQVRRYRDERPWSLEKSYYPQEYFDRGAIDLQQKADIPEGTVAYLNRTLGIRQVGYRDQIVVRPPNDDEANFFKLPINGTVSVTLIIRIGYAESRVRKGHSDSLEKALPFRVTVNTYPSDRHQFVTNYGRVTGTVADPIDLIESSAYDNSGSL
jgi:DNA-binding GntR family transcriptional regulator